MISPTSSFPKQNEHGEKEMSTHCRIGIVHENGSVTSIACQFDGYPSWVGKTPLGHYTDKEKILNLLKLGDLRTLGKNLDGESLDDEPRTVAYHRDYGEDLDIRENPDLENFMMDENEEWNYLYDCGEWYYLDNRGEYDENGEMIVEPSMSLKLLTEDFCREALKFKDYPICWILFLGIQHFFY